MYNIYGSYFKKLNIENFKNYDTSEAITTTLVWSLPPNINISKKDICVNSGFIFDNDICYKDDSKTEEISIEIDSPTDDVTLETNEMMCNQLAKYGFYYQDSICYNPTGEPITFESNEGSIPLPSKIEEFKNNVNANNTTIEVTYSQFPNDSTNLSSNIANGIAKSGNIPINSIGDPVIIEAPSIEENIPFSIADPDYYLLNKFDDKEMKIITDVTFFNKKLQNLSANNISDIIQSICSEMNENCEVIFFENFDKKTKVEFVIKLKNKKKLNAIKEKFLSKFKSLDVDINRIKILK